MIDRWNHPGFAALNRYVDDELDEQNRAHVAAHITGCTRCRETVDRIRALGEAARTLPQPGAPGELLDRILERRAAGERVILPTDTPGRPRRRPRVPARIAAAIATVVAAGALALLAPEVEAGDADLTMAPAAPVASDQIDFEYRDAGLFDDQDHLALRARYRTPDRSYQLTAAYLERDDDGRYHATITLPDSVVYAVFVVEDLAGMTLDDNHGRYWEATVHDGTGQPTYEALMARARDLFGRDWEAGLDAAEAIVQRFPDRPEGWAMLHARESQILDDQSVSARHRAELARLDRLIRAEAAPDPEDMAALAFYAARLGDATTAGYWARRALAAPDRVSPLMRAAAVTIVGRNAEQRLASLERLWRETGPELALARRGFDVALSSGAPAATVKTWYERARDAEQGVDLNIAALLLSVPGIQDYAVTEVRHGLEQYGEAVGEERALFRTVPQEQRFRTRRTGEARAQLADALLVRGEVQAGLDQFRLAAAASWSPVVLEAATSALLAHGDTAGARHAAVRLAVDPSLPPDQVRALMARFGPAVDAPAWRDELADARMSMRRELFADEFIRYVNGAVPLRDANGRIHDLKDLTDGEVAVVVYWSWRCLPAREDVPAINRFRGILANRDIPVIVVTPEAHSAGLRAALEQTGADFQVYTDVRARVEAQFGSGATPEYFILDQRGRIRFRSETDMVAQQALLLKSRGTAVAAAVTR